MPEFVFFDPPCRPGVTGMATVAFAREETILARVPRDQLRDYIHAVVTPAAAAAAAAAASDCVSSSIPFCAGGIARPRKDSSLRRRSDGTRNGSFREPDPSLALARMPVPAPSGPRPSRPRLSDGRLFRIEDRRL